ncbi:MAG TPA: hypothetical protein PL032_07685 [Syntrophorhabdus sp.]|nr:hypothetical protein [Syntrophorhabdus sp.]HOH26845.1 hypothetical protein [Syntrophorhabdus sp.]HQB35435.1 hypothetical protein [Syntrophorhabdus sp.]
MMWTRSGEDITRSATGMVTTGTMREFPTSDYNDSGKTGVTISTGKESIPGVSGSTAPSRQTRGRSSDVKESGNTVQDQRFASINSEGDNPRCSIRGKDLDLREYLKAEDSV